MLQKLFGSEVKAERPKKLKHPKGPGFNRAYERVKTISGSELRFMAPHPCGDAGMVFEDDCPDSVDLGDQAGYITRREDGGKDYYCGDNQLRYLFSSSWQFNGWPIIEGYMGDLRLNISIQQVALESERTLFHAEHLAQAIRRDVEGDALRESMNGWNEDEWDFTETCWPHYLGLINWQWVKRNGTPWLYYELQPVGGRSGIYTWVTPLSDQHYLQCDFFVTKSMRGGGNNYSEETHIASEPYLTLMHQIMDSMMLTMSPQEKARQLQVHQEYPNRQLLLHPGPSAKQLHAASYVMWRTSASGLGIEREEGVDYRANPKDVAAWIKQRTEFRPLPGMIEGAVQREDFPEGLMFFDDSWVKLGN